MRATLRRAIDGRTEGRSAAPEVLAAVIDSQVPWGVLVVAVGLIAGQLLLRRIVTVPTADPAPSPHLPRTSVIIPARDEALTLPDLLESLARQVPAATQIIVVDDGSSDATAAVAASHGAVVIDPGPPPEGWVGKTWACWRGAQVAEGETLVFLDADVRLGDGALAAVVAAHRDLAPDGLLSVQPYHRTVRAYEQLSAIPNLVSAMGSGVFAGGRLRDAPIAFGPCVVTDAATYRAVDGHRAVAGEVVEDLHLARTYAAAGRPVRSLAGGGSVWFRMYPRDLRQLIEGWTKNLAEGSQLAPAVPTFGAVLWVMSVAAVGGAVVWGATHGDLVAWGALGWVVVAVQLRGFLARLGRFQWWTWAVFPVVIAAFIGLFATSAVRRCLFHRVAWRGRTIPVGRT